MKTIARLILKWVGWKVIVPPYELDKSVICVAPHTSNYDFFLGKLYYMAIGKRARFLAKDSLFIFPLGIIMRALGGIPVNRKARTHLVDKVAAQFHKHKRFHVAVTPEGTRSAAREWKSGFYRIALAANVPIELAVIDYGEKRLGVFEVFHPTGNQEADIHYIRSKYNSTQALKPKQFTEYKKKKNFKLRLSKEGLIQKKKKLAEQSKLFTEKLKHLPSPKLPKLPRKHNPKEHQTPDNDRESEQ